ncbi:hypothetical protein ACFFGH_19200 [Lysobacter korlensis]|uniref:Secreted protein n=1 Tax=Lysobacter korlensis TaxID=553636 RepID=A0ABV6RSL8_9GAMM
MRISNWMTLPAGVTAALLFSSLAVAATAALPKPEIVRDAVPAQAPGQAHTLRTIPEACARLEGMFTGASAQPYRFAAVRTSPNCQPRARFVDAAEAAPSVQDGWKLNDLLRVPNAACPGQQAVVQVWRKPVNVAPPKLDAQGRARLYLDEAKQAAAANRTPNVPMYAAVMAVEGAGCG